MWQGSGFLFEREGLGCALDEVQETWKKLMPDFTEFNTWRLNARNYTEPHNRPRVFLVSVACKMAAVVGDPTAPRAHADIGIEGFLEHYSRQDIKDEGLEFNNKMMRNLGQVKRGIRRSNLTGIIVADGCRDPANTYKANFHVNVTGALTCNNRYLGVFTALNTYSSKVTATPRKLSNIEKSKICCVLPQTLPLLKTLFTKSIGNMVPESRTLKR